MKLSTVFRVAALGLGIAVMIGAGVTANWIAQTSEEEQRAAAAVDGTDAPESPEPPVRTEVPASDDSTSAAPVPAQTVDPEHVPAAAASDLVEGEFDLHFQQAYSIEKGEHVDALDADIEFSTCAGGISSITFTAPRGICSVEDAHGRQRRDPETDALLEFARIRGVDPADLPWKLSTTSDSRTATSDVLIVRTQGGGYAKLVILERDRSGGDWQRYPATIRYVLNPRAPWFGGKREGVLSSNGLLLDAEPPATPVVDAFRPAGGSLPPLALPTGVASTTPMPTEESSQELLLSRKKYGDYEKATYSFRFGIRDDPNDAQARNDWDLQFSTNDSFRVRMVTDDVSVLAFVGALDWTTLAATRSLPLHFRTRLRAAPSAVYLIHTEDADTRYVTLLRVTHLVPGDRVAFEWVSVQSGTLKTSPGLELDAATASGLHALLMGWDLGGRAFERKQVATDPVRRDTLVHLSQASGDMHFPAGTTLTSVIDAFARGGVTVTTKPHVTHLLLVPIEASAPKRTPADVLDIVSRQLGLRWYIRKDGSVELIRADGR